MKINRINIILILFLLSILLIGCENQKQKTEDLARFKKLKWMENIWRGRQGDAKLYESWHKKNFRLMDGISYTTDVNGKRVYSQDMRIEQNNNQIYYIIKLPGDQQLTLKLSSVTDTSAVFLNQNKGYPQRVIYRHTANDSMVVSLAGINEGSLMKTRLNYEKD
jgi:hypothetical protein